MLWCCLLIPGLTNATPIEPVQLRADATAYQLSLFLGNLSPIPWPEIDAAWSRPNDSAVTDSTGYLLLTQYATASLLVPEIKLAIRNKDRQGLFESTTRAMARALLDLLDTAQNELQAGTASTVLTAARGLYRVFEEGIRNTDPAGYRELGQAWLLLSNAAGSRGVLGVGAVDSDPAEFLSAKNRIRTYISGNFDPAVFTRRSILSPLPEMRVRHQGETRIPATLPPGSFIGDQSPLPRLVLNFEEQGIDETQLPLVAYGDMLFDSPEIFGDPARSLGLACSSCHNRSDINQDFFIPGVSHQAGAVDVDSAFFNALANDQRADSLDIPSLRGLRFTGPYGRDGRFASLRDFTRNVIVNEFAGSEPTPFMLDSLIAYMLEFDFLPNDLLSSAGRLSDTSPLAARRGEKLFNQPFAQMNGQSCASCHIPGANFLDRKSHDIGSVRPAYAGSRAGALDTPTLLGSRFTAPYFHDGSLPALADVVDWFDARYSLELSTEEQSDLTAYLEVVGDSESPYEIFDEVNTPFKLMFGELTTFASTLDTLIPRRDALHAGLLIDTVAKDLIADASVMSNLRAKGDIYQLAYKLRDVGQSIASGDWQSASLRWKEFNELLPAIEPEAY